jgi:hypothetical protein
VLLARGGGTWRHQGPFLRTIVALDQGLVDVAPLFAKRAYGGLHRSRLLGRQSPTPIEPVAQEGQELQVALVIAEPLSKEVRTHIR